MPDPSDRGLVESLLMDVFGDEVRVTRWTRIEPWFVVRCDLESSSTEVPRSVIVKSLREHPTGFRTDPRQVLTEQAALEFLADIDLDLAPRVLASELEAGVLVLEDLAPRRVLFELLREGDPSSPEGLAAFARTLGTLAGATVGRWHEYYERRSILGPVDPRAGRLRLIGSEWSETLGYCEALSVPMASSVEADIADVLDVLADPGPFLALSNGDAGMNNYLVDGSDGRLIDFEFAGYRHALIDAVCLHVPSPIWMTVADPVTSGVEEDYRSVLAERIPEAVDDNLYGRGLAAACLAIAVERLHRIRKLDGRLPGHESRRQMVSTLEFVIRTVERQAAFPSASGWFRKVNEALRHRWPDADLPFDPSVGYTVRE